MYGVLLLVQSQKLFGREQHTYPNSTVYLPTMAALQYSMRG